MKRNSIALLSAETSTYKRVNALCVVFRHFPFVVVPPHVQVASLRQDKPFLLNAILAAASYDNRKLQLCLSRELRHRIGSNMIYGNNSSLEVLQALLVHVAWQVILLTDQF